MQLQSGSVAALLGWALAVFIYPGLLFGAALALVGEWLFAASRPIFTRRAYRLHSRPRHLLQPLYDFLKLASRQASRNYTFTILPYSGADPVGAARPVHPWPSLLCAIAPVLALGLLPFPGSPTGRGSGIEGDLFVALALLAVQPVCQALLHLYGGSLAAVARGVRDMGRLVTGLFPALLAVAALAEVAGSRSLLMAGLTAAPDAAIQVIVRLLSGVALLLALPWWTASRDEDSEESAGSYAGRRLQRAAVAAFWATLVLPMPGDRLWAVLVAVVGTLFAYLAMRFVAERAAPTLRERDAARLVWAAGLPLAAVSLVFAFLSGA